MTSAKPSNTREISPTAIDCSSDSATSLNRVVKTVRPSLNTGCLHHDEAEDHSHEQDLPETIDRAGRRKRDQQQRRNYDGTGPNHRSAAGDSDPNEKRNASPQTVSNSCRPDASRQPRSRNQSPGQSRQPLPPRRKTFRPSEPFPTPAVNISPSPLAVRLSHASGAARNCATIKSDIGTRRISDHHPIRFTSSVRRTQWHDKD